MKILSGSKKKKQQQQQLSHRTRMRPSSRGSACVVRDMVGPTGAEQRPDVFVLDSADGDARSDTDKGVEIFLEDPCTETAGSTTPAKFVMPSTELAVGKPKKKSILKKVLRFVSSKKRSTNMTHSESSTHPSLVTESVSDRSGICRTQTVADEPIETYSIPILQKWNEPAQRPYRHPVPFASPVPSSTSPAAPLNLSELSTLSGSAPSNSDESSFDSPSKLQRQESMGNDSVLNVRQALQDVEEQLRRASTAGQKVSRQRLIEALVMVAETVENVDDVEQEIEAVSVDNSIESSTRSGETSVESERMRPDTPSLMKQSQCLLMSIPGEQMGTPFCAPTEKAHDSTKRDNGRGTAGRPKSFWDPLRELFATETGKSRTWDNLFSDITCDDRRRDHVTSNAGGRNRSYHETGSHRGGTVRPDDEEEEECPAVETEVLITELHSFEGDETDGETDEGPVEDGTGTSGIVAMRNAAMNRAINPSYSETHASPSIAMPHRDSSLLDDATVDGNRLGEAFSVSESSDSTDMFLNRGEWDSFDEMNGFHSGFDRDASDPSDPWAASFSDESSDSASASDSSSFFARSLPSLGTFQHPSSSPGRRSAPSQW